MFDVGANRGDYAMAVLERRPQANVHCFEPSHAAYKTLAASLSDRATLHRCALAETPGEAAALLQRARLRIVLSLPTGLTGAEHPVRGSQ